MKRQKNNLNFLLNKWNYEQDLLRKDRDKSNKFIKECDSEKLMIFLSISKIKFYLYYLSIFFVEK
jgi:hypothetical protein